MGFLISIVEDDLLHQSVLDQWKLCKVIRRYKQSAVSRKEYQLWRLRHRWQALGNTINDLMLYHIHIGQIRVKNMERRIHLCRSRAKNPTTVVMVSPAIMKDPPTAVTMVSPDISKSHEFNLDIEETECSQIFVCRICREGGDLIQPCLCRGSVGYIHIDCLKIWVFSSSNQKSRRYYCELCSYPYIPNVREKLETASEGAACIQMQGNMCKWRCFSCTQGQISAIIIALAILIVTLVLLVLLLAKQSKS
jgi:hypothetical protein